MNNTDTNSIDLTTSGTDTFEVLASTVKITLEDITKDPSSGSWGEGNFTFNITANTTGINNITVFLWTGSSSNGPWSLVGQQNYTPDHVFGTPQQFNFSKFFNCGVSITL